MGNCCATNAGADAAVVISRPSKEEELAKGMNRMSAASVDTAKTLFRQYRHRASLQSPDGINMPSERQSFASTPSPNSDQQRMPRMTKTDLQRLLHDVDEELFGFVWNLFDPNGDGIVYADDFVAAMAMLTTSADPNVGIEEQMRVCFVMFDMRGDGRLS